MRTYQYTTFNSLRLREHVEDASKNPILIFPEGEWILDFGCFSVLFLSLLSCYILCAANNQSKTPHEESLYVYVISEEFFGSSLERPL